ncbi:hypothetical protein niasHS_009450 [Heterodera schachtii]|uniref:DNA2/NAM7 helicase-like C-terminal domain-containing protein n=1 Tax=Heterodera schachtii TaxID=97005 RepID=A0ABD2J792_HETSC
MANADKDANASAAVIVAIPSPLSFPFHRTMDQRRLFIGGVTADIHLAVHPSARHSIKGSGFGLESITDQLLKSPRMEETVLKRCYRSHGSLVECVSFASYVPHGEVLLPVEAVTKSRTAITTSAINLPMDGIPLVMIHSEGRIQMDETSFSLSNVEHRRIAQEVVLILDANLPKSNTIVIICLYLYEKEQLALAMKEARVKKMLSRTVEVHNVDSYQAKEADLVIVVTTKTAATADQNPFGSSRISGFFQDSQRATVALSRAREGMFVIADFNTLMGCKVWGRFVEKANEMVPIFNDEYLRMMESTKIKRVDGILANLNGYSPIPSSGKFTNQADIRNPAGGPVRGRSVGWRAFAPSQIRASHSERPRPSNRGQNSFGQGNFANSDRLCRRAFSFGQRAVVQNFLQAIHPFQSLHPQFQHQLGWLRPNKCDEREHAYFLLKAADLATWPLFITFDMRQRRRLRNGLGAESCRS